MSSEPRLRTVVIDDAPDIRVLIKIILERSDRFEIVAEAGDGQDGLDLVAAQQPDLVLLDLSMPRMDGLETLDQLRERASAATVVVISGFEAGKLAAAALEHGAHGYVEKSDLVHSLVPALLSMLEQEGAPRS